MRQRAAQGPPALEEVLDLLRVGTRVVVRRVLQRVVGDRQLEAVAEDPELGLVELLGLVGDVARLDARSERPALHGVGEDDRRGAGVLGGGLVGGVDLAVVVAAAAQLGQVVVGQVLDELGEARVRPEEVLADVAATGDRELLELAVEGVVHLLDEQAVDVACEQVVPLATPDDLDHVPAGAAEGRLELLDDLAVAAHRAVQPLQVAVDDEGQVVEALARGDVERSERFGLVRLAVAHECPDPRIGGVEQTAVVEVAVVARLVDGADRPESHRHRRELPELRHEPRVRVRRQARAGAGLAPEVVELVDAQTPLEERAGVDARRGVALVEDLVARTAGVLAPEEVVEADLVEGRRRGIGREVAADPGELVVGPQDHRHRVPADQPADAPLHRLVARERGLLLRADGVDVAGLGQRRQPDLELAGALEELVDDEPGARLAFLGDDLVERREPVLGLVRVDVRQLVLELVEIHACRQRSPFRRRPTFAGRYRREADRVDCNAVATSITTRTASAVRPWRRCCGRSSRSHPPPRARTKMTFRATTVTMSSTWRWP